MPNTIQFFSYHIHIECRNQRQIGNRRPQHREKGSTSKPYLAQLLYPQRTEKDGGSCRDYGNGNIGRQYQCLLIPADFLWRESQEHQFPYRLPALLKQQEY